MSISASTKELFGIKEGNVKYVCALKNELEQRGHIVMMDTVYRKQVHKRR
jgi:hypothetical protein